MPTEAEILEWYDNRYDFIPIEKRKVIETTEARTIVEVTLHGGRTFHCVIFTRTNPWNARLEKA